MVLKKWCVRFSIDARFADKPYIRLNEEVWYCHKLRDAIDAGMEVEDEDPQLQCWFFGKQYTSKYLLLVGSRRTRTLELKV